MRIFAYLFKPWSNNTQQRKEHIPKQPELAQHAQEKTAARAALTEAHYGPGESKVVEKFVEKFVEKGVEQPGIEMTYFPPFIPTAPPPHGTREFLHAAIAEQSGTPQQVSKASEDIRRVKEEALRQVKGNQGQVGAGKGQAISSLKAILAQSPQPQECKENTCCPPPTQRCSCCCTQNPSSKKVDSAGSMRGGHTLEKKKKPSYSHIRIPKKPQKALQKLDRYLRPPQVVDPRLSPLGPMAERLQAMAMEEYDSERDCTD